MKGTIKFKRKVKQENVMNYQTQQYIREWEMKTNPVKTTRTEKINKSILSMKNALSSESRIKPEYENLFYEHLQNIPIRKNKLKNLDKPTVSSKIANYPTSLENFKTTMNFDDVKKDKDISNIRNRKNLIQTNILISVNNSGPLIHKTSVKSFSLLNRYEKECI